MAEQWPLEAVQDGVLTRNEVSKVEKVVHDLLGKIRHSWGVK